MKPSHQARGDGLVSTIWLIASVTEAKLCPGSITTRWASAPSSCSVPAMRVLLFGCLRDQRPRSIEQRARGELGARIGQSGEIGRTWLCLELDQNAVGVGLFFGACNATLRIIDVAEDDRL